MQRGASPQEQRAFGRRESRIHAFVRVPSRTPEPCIVRNFSEGGALLVFSAPCPLPDRFRLTVDVKGLDVMCEVRRRGELEFGVQFVQEQADIAERLGDEIIASPPAFDPSEVDADDLPPPLLLSSGGIVTVVPGYEVRDHIIL